MEWSKKYFIKKLIKCIIWFDIASEEIELFANPFNPFFMSGRIRQLIFYYIHPDQILSRLITHLSRVMHSLDYNNQSGDISIPIQSIFFKLAPDYTYTKLYNSTKKSKTMTNEDLIFIHETFDNFEKLLNYITNEDKFTKGQYDFMQLVKLEQIVRKLQKRIYRLKNYLLEIPIR